MVTAQDCLFNPIIVGRSQGYSKIIILNRGSANPFKEGGPFSDTGNKDNKLYSSVNS